MSFSPEACRRLLFDRSKPLLERCAAAESLTYDASRETARALLTVLADASEGDDLRGECAESLGVVWAALGVDHDALGRIPLRFLYRVLAELITEGRPVDIACLPFTREELLGAPDGIPFVREWILASKA